MLKKNKKTLILTCIIIVLPIIVGVVLWDKLPETMATHFGINNDANGFSSKLFAVVGLPIILLLIQFICAVVTAKDPRKQNISNKLYVLVLWIVPCISIFVSTFVYAYNLGVKINISLFARMFIGLLFIIMGNYFPKMRQNYSMGIKLPWTLANEENWNKTHRLAGIVYIGVGISIILTTLITVLNNIWIIFTAVFVAFAIPSVYSFMLHARKGL